MKIFFEEITLQNFLSYKNKQSFIFNNKGISLLSGVNGNGKTALPSALYFALFGKSDRGKLNDLINFEVGKNLLVELKLKIGNDNFKIIRGIKPNKFEIYINNEKIDDEANTKNQQKKLLSILNLDEVIFFQMVYLGTSLKDTKNFFELNQKEKEAILNILIDTSHFNTIRDNAKEYFKFLKQEKEKVEYGLDILKNDIINIKESIAKQEKQNNEIVKNKEKILNEIENDIKSLEEKIESNDNKLSKKQKVKDKIDELSEKMKELENNISELNTTKSELNHKIFVYNENEKNKTICPNCGAEIKKELNYDINTLQKELDDVENKIGILMSDYTDLEWEYHKLNKGLNKLNQLEYENTSFKEQIQTLKNRYEKVKSMQEIDIDYSLIESKQKQSEELQEKIVAIHRKIEDVLELIEILSEDNLKGSYIEKFLPVLNYHLNHYLEKVNLPYIIKINKNLKETIFYENNEITYQALSAGQKMRVIVALLFTFLKLIKMKNNIDFNILFLDEFINGSLDTNGVEDTLNGLLEFSKDKEIILITHNNDIKQMDEIFSNVYEIVKDNGSKIIKKS